MASAVLDTKMPLGGTIERSHSGRAVSQSGTAF
jgi:hypothetical protein